MYPDRQYPRHSGYFLITIHHEGRRLKDRGTGIFFDERKSEADEHPVLVDDLTVSTEPMRKTGLDS
jgi:hypothetical protein